MAATFYIKNRNNSQAANIYKKVGDHYKNIDKSMAIENYEKAADLYYTSPSSNHNKNKCLIAIAELETNLKKSGEIFDLKR